MNYDELLEQVDTAMDAFIEAQPDVLSAQAWQSIAAANQWRRDAERCIVVGDTALAMACLSAALEALAVYA